MNDIDDLKVTVPTAAQLNAHLAAGGKVIVATYTRALIYAKRNAGDFTEGNDGSLYVRHGKSRNRLATPSCLLVKIELLP